MKIALVALPHPQETAAAPPLPLAYVAALLEQQRHIVRIYDLAVRGTTPNGDRLASLQTFRPHVALLVSESAEARLAVEPRLASCGAAVLHLCLSMREWASGHEVASALRPADHCRSPSKDEQNVIIDVLLALDDDLDALPFPARHLLPLEHYPMHTSTGDLRTPLLIGRRVGGTYQMRNPALLVSEIRSVAHEHGILHFLLAGAPLTHDRAWLRALLGRLREARLGIRWEASVDFERLDRELLEALRSQGCEGLCFAFDAMAVLDVKEARAALVEAVSMAHDLGMFVRGRISLEPRFSSMPALVDMAATFGLDDVQFYVLPLPPVAERTVGEPPLESFAELVRERYQASRSRQQFIERFGARLGPVIWRMGRSGLLGSDVRRQASGGDVPSEVVAGG
ncbi:MAG: hypothetical protein DIU80_003890 [Chloroflexota bacterium]